MGTETQALAWTVARRRMRRLRENELRALLLLGDATAAVLATAGAPRLWATIDHNFIPRAELGILGGSFVVLWVLLLWLTGGGDLLRPRFGRRTLGSVARTLAMSAVIVLATFFFVPFFAPRGVTLLTLPLVAVTAVGWRFAYLRALRKRVVERRVAVVGIDEASTRVAKMLSEWDGVIRYNVVAFLSSDGNFRPNESGIRVLDVEEDPWKQLADLEIDQLVVGHTRNVPPTLLAELTRCYEHGVEATAATALYEQVTGRVLASALEADWYAELPTYSHGMYMLGKRVVDIVGALIGGAFALVLAPLIAAAILVDSGRPVLYRQTRVGLRGEPFVLHKYRTMRPDAEVNGPAWSTPNDGRVTRVGRFLRRTRLDELPQLWDVLGGKMSLIGPRPERPEFVERLARELPLYRARTLVRPGITGWAQIQYPYAETLEKNLAKLEYDLYYIRHLSPSLDLAVCLRTLPVMVLPRRHRSDLPS